LVLAALPAAIAGTLPLYEWTLNIDGTVSDYFSPGVLPSGITASVGISTQTTGLGNVAVNISGAGAHSVIAFFDHEIDELLNTYFNEYGATSGSVPGGLSWEIDEPGYTFGDIFGHVTAGLLDNSNGVPAASPDDVSMALGWNFVLGGGETAQITFLLGAMAPTSGGFYLRQTDPDSGKSIFFNSGLEIRSINGTTPEPSSCVLFVIGIVGLALSRRYSKAPTL